MTEYRASFDAAVTFSNGGDLTVHGFRLDVPSPDIDQAGIAALFVASLGLLMAATRGPVVTRNNAGGSGNGDTAGNAAVIWTVTATAQMADILTWLTAYLDECGRNGGKPLTGPALERFLSLERQPRRPPHLGTATATARWINPVQVTPEPAMAIMNGQADCRHALSQDFRIVTLA